MRRAAQLGMHSAVAVGLIGVGEISTTNAVSSSLRRAVADLSRRFQSKNPDEDTASHRHIFFTG
jgi:hypothetical protein